MAGRPLKRKMAWIVMRGVGCPRCGAARGQWCRDGRDPIPVAGHNERVDAAWQDESLQRALIKVTGLDPRLVELYLEMGISPRRAPQRRPSEDGPGPYGLHVLERRRLP